MKESVIPFLTIMYNSYEYYKQLENKKNKIKVEDKWILSKLNSLIKKVAKDLENYLISDAFLKIQNFVVNDFSRGYIKMTRDRNDTREIIMEVLKKASLLIAPFAPYISECIYSEFSKESVHLCAWPKYDEKKINLNLEKEFGNALMIIEKGLAERDKAHMGLKWPLAKATLFVKTQKKYENLKEIIKSQLNIKELEIKSPKINKDESYNEYIELDTKITPELESEGYAREISRHVQSFRKKLGLKKKDKIELVIFTDDELKKILEKMKNFIRERTNSKKLEINKLGVTTYKERFKKIIDFKIKNKEGKIAIIILP